MKKIAKKTVLILLAGIVAVACQDEPVTPTPTPGPEAETGMYTVNYGACDFQSHDTVLNDDESLNNLLDSLLAVITGNGQCFLFFRDPVAVTSGQDVADQVLLTTDDRQEVLEWCRELYLQKYNVKVNYNLADSGVYLGIATKYATLLPFPSNFTPIPLTDYLPGTWVLDTNVIITADDDLANNNYHRNYNFGYHYYEYLTFTGSEVYFSADSVTEAYTVINSMTVNFPHYGSENTQILQIGQDSMLVKGYHTSHAFSVSFEYNEYTFLFHRQ